MPPEPTGTPFWVPFDHTCSVCRAPALGRWEQRTTDGGLHADPRCVEHKDPEPGQERVSDPRVKPEPLAVDTAEPSAQS